MYNEEPAYKKIRQHRWIILLGGFLLSLMGGMSYAWGSFVVPLIRDWEWTAAEANMPFTVMIVVFAITMIPAGWLQDRIGPRKVAIAGALLFLLGYGMASMLSYIPHPTWLILTYGIFVGIACGLTYSCIHIYPMAKIYVTIVKIFSNKVNQGQSRSGFSRMNCYSGHFIYY